MIEVIKRYDQNIDFINMKNEYLDIVVTNYGCHLVSVFMEDQYGKKSDVVLGFDDLQTYQKQDKYIGAIVGRVANRIKKGTFTLNDINYHLAVNNGPNHLHGGIEGFDTKVFDYTLYDNKIVFHYLSKDKEEGYPGDLDLYIEYVLEGKTLTIHYLYSSNRDTLVNLTNHSYFNLNLGFENIENHLLKIKADEISCVDQDGLTTSQTLDVTNTPFDFREYQYIKNQISKEHIQLQYGNGFDHPFKLASQDQPIQLFHEGTKRRLTIHTSMPYVHVYTANYLDGTLKGKNNHDYQARDGICLETEFLPDSIHLEKEPKVLVKKGESYKAFTSYTFEVVK